MSDASSTPTSDEGTKGGNPDGQSSQSNDIDLSKFISREEFQKVVEQRDELKKTLRDIEKGAHEKKKSEADKTKDFEAMRTALEAEATSYKQKAESLEGQLHRTILERDALSALAEVSTDPEVALMLLRDELEITERDGRLSVRPKASSLSIKEWAERTIEAKGKSYLLKSKRKPGTDTKGSDSANGGGEDATIPTDLQSWPVAKQKEWMVKNPKLAAIAVNRLFGG